MEAPSPVRSGGGILKPRLSICIPTYNRAKYLEHTLESIISQCGPDVEVVVSDNASDDDTSEVVEKFKSRHPLLVYEKHPTNLGADRNYMRVVEMSSADYCWLFGSDDVMLPGVISRVLQEIRSGVDVFVCGFTLCTIDMQPLGVHPVFRRGRDEWYDLTQPNQRRRYFRSAITTTAFFSFLGSLIVKKSSWDRAPIDEDRYIGSLWSHSAKIFSAMRGGLQVKFMAGPFLNKRGENDSFLTRGIAQRIGVSVFGYQQLAEEFLRESREEREHVHRVLRYEWPLSAFIGYRQRSRKSEETQALDRVFEVCYAGSYISLMVKRCVYRSETMSRLFMFIRSLVHTVRGWARGFRAGS